MDSPEETGDDSHQLACYRAKQVAFRFLSHRARSQAEVRHRLVKTYPLPVVEEVLCELRAQGYLDDAAFAREWRRRREESRPRGQAIIQQELLRLGVEPEVIQDALDGFDAADNAYRAALIPARRLDDSDYPRFRQRLWAYLQRRGFDHSIISDAVSRIWRELTDPQHSIVDTEPQEQQRENVELDGADGQTYEEGENH